MNNDVNWTFISCVYFILKSKNDNKIRFKSTLKFDVLNMTHGVSTQRIDAILVQWLISGSLSASNTCG